MIRRCGDCRHCVFDSRHTDYRRGSIWFCERKTLFFSRNYRPGEGGRILPEDRACPDFEPSEPVKTKENTHE